jgi:hypothetical protein
MKKPTQRGVGNILLLVFSRGGFQYADEDISSGVRGNAGDKLI